MAEDLRRPGQQLLHTIQTNGTMLTDEVDRFMAEHCFLVGLSIDGPPELHCNRLGTRQCQSVLLRTARGGRR